MNKRSKPPGWSKAETQATQKSSVNKSRSSKYRAIDKNPGLHELKAELKTLFKNRRGFKQHTLDSYSKLKIFTEPGYQKEADGSLVPVQGFDPEIVKQGVRRSARLASVQKAAATRRAQGDRKRAEARAMIAKGEKKVAIARKLGIGDRALRKLLKD